jgi:hypothetical protein
MPELELALPYELNGITLRRVTQALIDGCPNGLPNNVFINFAGLGFIKPAGVTFLSNLIMWLASKNVAVRFTGHDRNTGVLRFLDDSLFFEKHLGAKLTQWATPRSTTRPLVHAHHGQSQDEIRNRFVPWLSNRLSISKASLHDFQVCLLELFNNIQDHSSLEIGCLFAQHFPNMNQVGVAIADFGIGIPSAVRRIHPELRAVQRSQQTFSASSPSSPPSEARYRS